LITLEDSTKIAVIGANGRTGRIVQPGRRIATLRRPAGIGTNVAFMDPE